MINSLEGFTPFKKVTFGIPTLDDGELPDVQGKRFLLIGYETRAPHAYWESASAFQAEYLNKGYLSFCAIPYEKGHKKNVGSHFGVDKAGFCMSSGTFFPANDKGKREYRKYFNLVGEKALYGDAGRR